MWGLASMATILVSIGSPALAQQSNQRSASTSRRVLSARRQTRRTEYGRPGGGHLKGIAPSTQAGIRACSPK
jgi:hypothetical protein